MMGITFISNAIAGDFSSSCLYKAETAVAEFVGKNNYDKNGFTALECALALNKAVVICDVSASKGDGAANDSYRVILNNTCSEVYRVELTGEE